MHIAYALKSFADELPLRVLYWLLNLKSESSRYYQACPIVRRPATPAQTFARQSPAQTFARQCIHVPP